MGYFIKAKIMGGQIELDKTVYTLPKIGENIIIKKILDIILIRF
jgi:hypothetical protein